MFSFNYGPKNTFLNIAGSKCKVADIIFKLFHPLINDINKGMRSLWGDVFVEKISFNVK